MEAFLEEQGAEINLRILVVCTGNIHRSPFAQAMLRKALDEAGLGDIAVESAGLEAMEGDSVPAEAQAEALTWGVDLAEHRARQVTGDMVHDADLILTMDACHSTAIATAFPAQRDKVNALAIFDPEGGPDEIQDPAGTGDWTLGRVYSRIARCAAEVASYYASP
jgi:protein-tyrosine phosphatase